MHFRPVQTRTTRQVKAAPSHEVEPFDFKLIYRNAFDMGLGGPVDTASAVSIGAGATLTSPFFAGTMPAMVPFATSLAGSTLLARRLLAPWRRHFHLKSSINVRSSPAPVYGTSGLMVGYATDTGEPIIIDDDNLFRHVWIVGQSGVGKTVAGSLMMFQQIQRGGGVLFVDGKLDEDNILTIYQFAKWAGRAHDFFVLNPGNPSLSNTYNPMLEGDPDEIASRLLSLIPSTESNAGADYYKQSANQALVTIISACQKTGLAYNFYDLAVLLNNSRALEELQATLVNRFPRSDEARNLRLFLDNYRHPSNDPKNPLRGQIDVKKMKDVLGGMVGRLFTFGTGTFGEVMNTYKPDLRLYEAIKGNKIVYAALPTMGKPDAAANFGKMLLGDFRTAVSWLQKNKADRPKIPYMCFFDEAGSYVNEAWARIFEQARSAGIFLCPAVQTESNFTAISEDFAEMVTGNTTTKLFFRIGSVPTSESAADLIGKHIDVRRSMTATDSASKSQDALRAAPGAMTGDSSGESYAEREEEVHRVTPEQLRSLDKGESVMLYEGKDVYNLRIPFVNLTPEMKKKIGPIRINKPRYYKREGFNYSDPDKLDRFLSTTYNSGEGNGASAA